MLVTKQFPVTIDFYSMGKMLFGYQHCSKYFILCPTEERKGLERHEGEKMMKRMNLHLFNLNYPFKIKVLLSSSDSASFYHQCNGRNSARFRQNCSVIILNFLTIIEINDYQN